MSFYLFVCQTLLTFFLPAWAWPSGWQAASARAPDSLPVSKPRARFRSRSSRGLVPPASNKLATAPHWVPPLRSPLPAPALSLNAERKLGPSPSEQGWRGIFVRVICIERCPFVALLHPNSEKRAHWRTCTFPSDGCRPVPQPAMYPSQPTNQPAQPVSQLNPNYLANQNNLFAPVCYLF